MNKVSAYIISKNVESHIKECIQSIIWADEVVVIDDFSTDKTALLAASAGAKVIAHKFSYFGAQRNFALTQLKYDWVLCLDSDERVSVELKEEIIAALASPNPSDIYLAPRKTMFIKHWIKHSGWYPDYRHPVLFNRQKASYKDQLVHEDIDYKGNRIGYFKGDILHFSYESISQFVKKSDQYSTFSAAQMFERGKKAGILNFIFNPLNMFFKMFFAKRGFLDGKTGLLLALLYSSFYTLMKYAKLWEMQTKKGKK
ncbi:MAG: glycosyltransferase family 2 protein [Elusimicrobiota bacterium]|nr:glycosyltransferase family 2 protein [Elusimicrobiota bacterium]